MRLMAPAIGGAAIVLASALVWYFRSSERAAPATGDAPSAPSTSVVTAPAARAADAETPAPPPAAAPSAETAESPAPSVGRAPLPGETPSTPMTNLFTDLQREVPPNLAAGEREFAAEPIDAAWAPGAEAGVLAKFAQMPGLKLIDLQVECRSTMCRVLLTQPTGGAAGDGGPRSFNILLDSIDLEPRWMIMLGDRGNTNKSVAYLWREGLAPQQHPGEPHESNQ
jgi:hypothetical protein